MIFNQLDRLWYSLALDGSAENCNHG